MSRPSRSPGALLLATAVLACTAAWSAAPARAAAGAPDDDLPDGPGKTILLRACTTCHDLDEVVKFKGYYTRAQWKDIVVTMREYGAPLADGEVDLLSQYLTEVLGKKE